MDVEQQEHNAWLRTARLGASFAIVAVLAFVCGLFVGERKTPDVFSHIPLIGDGLDATPDSSTSLDDFWKAWNVLEERFVASTASSTEPTQKEKIQGAIAGLTASFNDPYTVYLPPEDAKIFQEDIQRSFSGVGMEISVNADKILTVIAPLKGTPAERAGIHAGDSILAIDGTSTDGISTDEAVKLIRGPKGTTVVFDVLRGTERLEISVVRDDIEVPTIDYSLDSATGIYTIELYSFTATADGLFNRALADLRQSGATKLIIDLRGNPGGYLNAAVSLAGHFIPKEEVVVTEDYKGNRENIVHRSDGIGGVREGTTIVILIDRGSASASEILAGALQDHGVATVIGTRSFGKGSVQELVSIDGGSLKVTIAKWLTPNGKSISDGGVTPDIEVDRTIEDVQAGKDPQRERAIEFLTTGK
jgi:carboxyl-terminal processing protease